MSEENPRLRPQFPASDFGQSVTDDGGDDGEGLLAVVMASPFCLINPVPGNLATRQRGGTAVLCGYSTFTPSSFKFRRMDQSGALGFCHFATPAVPNNCQPGDRDSSFQLLYSGFCVYNVATCAFSSSATQIVRSGDSNCTYPGPDSSNSNCGITSGDCTMDSTVTLISTTRTGNGICCAFSSPPNTSRIASGTANMTLSLQDDDPDAIARLIAGLPWGAFAGCATPPTCALAQWEARGPVSDYDFAYQEAEYQVTASGISPNTACCVQLQIFRRLFGVGAYALFGMIQTVANSDGAGNISITGTVPNLVGYQTYVATPLIFAR